MYTHLFEHCNLFNSRIRAATCVRDNCQARFEMGFARRQNEFFVYVGRHAGINANFDKSRTNICPINPVFPLINPVLGNLISRFFKGVRWHIAIVRCAKIPGIGQNLHPGFLRNAPEQIHAPPKISPRAITKRLYAKYF